MYKMLIKSCDIANNYVLCTYCKYLLKILASLGILTTAIERSNINDFIRIERNKMQASTVRVILIFQLSMLISFMFRFSIYFNYFMFYEYFLLSTISMFENATSSQLSYIKQLKKIKFILSFLILLVPFWAYWYATCKWSDRRA